ncbi:NAD(P)-binding domain-containing protein [Sphingomonas sp. RP10(2022)]|uniref:NAD(P)-binding domain-containing protein n=1 Tax=Sphingomonas liriopis TaxID=2949094 RepID=A0A9X2HU30_9SPHN|nr:NAD(P)/FAD-dependent oxidoreductase [Sphingomonas liriopis]MCP3735907.1 NAD(P)-binding domain-containing protein [Sphingomonas liriopis]
MATQLTTDAGQPALDWQDRRLPLADTADLRAALVEANVQTLLMVYVHLTHDEAMLATFQNYIKPPFAMPGTDIPEEYQQELREKLRHVLTTPGAAREDAPSKALMQRMMSVSVGEPVEDEFLPLLMDQIGFERSTPRREIAGRKPAPAGFKVLVIGAGLTGLAASIKLEEAGYEQVVIEKNPEIGGTWYENRYPGVGVDTPSHFYSYSFEITPEWTTYHPVGADMQKYLLHVTEKYDLRRHIRFETTVVSLAYDDEAAMWDVTVRGVDGTEEVLRVNAVINAHGPVNRWKWPNIPGFDTFRGVRMHTATWDPAVDLRGKRVAVIGTGASGAQLVPAIAGEVKDLTVFMRSCHWVIYNPEIAHEVPPGMKFALRHIPHFREWFRFRVYWFAADGLFANVLKDPEWPVDSPSVSALNEGMRQYALAHLDAKFADRPDLLEKLTPDFPIFSKRIILDNGWFDALKRDNVTLESGGIAEITETGIRMEDGTTYEVDVIVCATGFDVANMLGKLEVHGIGGRSLRDEWGHDDPRSYMGVTVPGYPNYFLTVGPNSAPNHAAGQNLISEVQVNYIIECLDWANASDKRAVEPRRDAFEAWNTQIDTRMQDMIWTHPKANSYYNNSKGRIFLSWPYRLVDYWNEMRGPKKDHFELH